ncbi:GTP cyclohydrolase FolE2 [Marinobacterium sediminicola]|uniref:GTP cyclohydrolase FolE2 n=1 Tax=Marinobacterium sediminicola TaxID=518898 RepID=A0ABY1S3N3_9GAMM|nr:GTP cyclohydrolase FolE2 [Marinobacterium sediminicola]ULG68181.1 GTP cyclohydrolase FolE2 [Marinobacterium sediminicola]SMR77707.1 GTP cyclohydrolase I [Marinobacterium sediminicola]
MNTAAHTLPDIAHQTQSDQAHTLDWVGMSGIDLPLQFQTDTLHSVTAKVDIHVDLCEPHHRGIHMSRLYLALQDTLSSALLNRLSLEKVLTQALTSHKDTSRTAAVRIQFDLPIQRRALKSSFTGWKSYPVIIDARLRSQQLTVELAVDIPYSSTCPCSSALSRQLLQQAFRQDFSSLAELSVEQISQWLEQHGSLATPHSQRSTARIRVRLQPQNWLELPLKSLIDSAETALQTAVQTAVKREDEQAFAALNGSNQMFCEDAARRLKQSLLADEYWYDFWVRVEHHESLHAHDAVAICTKGLPDGFTPLLLR